MKNALSAFVLLVASPIIWAQAAAVTGGGYALPTRINIAPGQVVTFYVHGIGANLTDRVVAPSLPMPTSLAGISAVLTQNFPGIPIPIFAVEPIHTCRDMSQPGCSAYTAVTVQIPFHIDAYNLTEMRGVPVPATWVRFSENGKVVATVDVEPYTDQIHVLTSCDALFGASDVSPCIARPMIVHASSGLVKPGEEIAIYAVGLGFGRAVEGDTVPSPVPVGILGISFDARPNALPSRPSATTVLSQPAFSGLIPGYVGLYQINVIVPDPGPGIQPCNRDFRGPTRIDTNLTINIIGTNSFDGAAICVQPASQ